jgi:multicomponent K+:H+ antiporter subunit C
MALLLAFIVAVLVAGGVWLLLRPRSWSVVLGLTLLGYAVNLFILLSGRIGRSQPPLVLPETMAGGAQFADPLPQALVLTAIVIGLGMTAFLVALALRGVAARGPQTDDADRIGEGPAEADNGPPT